MPSAVADARRSSSVMSATFFTPPGAGLGGATVLEVLTTAGAEQPSVGLARGVEHLGRDRHPALVVHRDGRGIEQLDVLRLHHPRLHGSSSKLGVQHTAVGGDLGFGRTLIRSLGFAGQIRADRVGGGFGFRTGGLQRKLGIICAFRGTLRLVAMLAPPRGWPWSGLP